jgi:hypothetical protein
MRNLLRSQKAIGRIKHSPGLRSASPVIYPNFLLFTAESCGPRLASPPLFLKFFSFPIHACIYVCSQLWSREGRSNCGPSAKFIMCAHEWWGASSERADGDGWTYAVQVGVARVCEACQRILWYFPMVDVLTRVEYSINRLVRIRVYMADDAVCCTKGEFIPPRISR